MSRAKPRRISRRGRKSREDLHIPLRPGLDYRAQNRILEVTGCKLAEVERIIRNLSHDKYDVIVFRKVLLPYDENTAKARLAYLTKKYHQSFFTQLTQKTVVPDLYLKLYEGEKTRLSSERLYQSLVEAEPIKIYDRSGPGIAKVYEESVERVGLANILPIYGMNIPLVNEEPFLERIPFLVSPEYNSNISSEPMVGINVPTRYVGSPYSYSPFHPEDGGLDSINAVLWSLYADAKLWHFILLDDIDDALAKFSTDGDELFFHNQGLKKKDQLDLLNYPNYKPGCPFPDNHKAFLRSLRYVDAAGVTSQFVVQQAGDIIYVAPGVLHQVINLCTNEAEAVNVGSRLWSGACRQSRKCFCEGCQITHINRPPDLVAHYGISRRSQYVCPYDGCTCAYDLGSDLLQHLTWHSNGNLQTAQTQFSRCVDDPAIDYSSLGKDLTRQDVVTEFVEGSMHDAHHKDTLKKFSVDFVPDTSSSDCDPLSEAPFDPSVADNLNSAISVPRDASKIIVPDGFGEFVNCDSDFKYKTSNSVSPAEALIPTNLDNIAGSALPTSNSKVSDLLTSYTFPSPPANLSTGPSHDLQPPSITDNAVVSGAAAPHFPAPRLPTNKVIKTPVQRPPRKPRLCERCGNQVLGDNLARHLRTCGVPLSCQFCNATVPRRGMKRHLRNCPAARDA
ncbi:hypothetical protein QAD02_012978 [Eretmocerus hayati]|uniref:Uncharacterized protein n=1 Tax=Eretmocerus hayati TaxID=131215 RepID=A0ACC2P2A7_9HYME|nr:hypothetical protein QAD02_012978 [Eretmocerus hayati]